MMVTFVLVPTGCGNPQLGFAVQLVSEECMAQMTVVISIEIGQACDV